ncbi:GIP, partial [Symbiodinium necroappetens]
AIRMQLQLDTSPTQETVEEYTRTLLAEMELLSLSAPDVGNKRQRVAAVTQDAGGDKGKGKRNGKGEADAGCVVVNTRSMNARHQVLKGRMIRARLMEGNISEAAIREAAQTAHESEKLLPTIPVKLACGSCDLHINQYCTLLSEVQVSPILSVKALLRLGYKIDWNASRCRVYHPKFGELEVDTSTGCPEVDEDVALELISQYELYVGRHDNRVARLRCIVEDLRSKGTQELVGLMSHGDSQADAALSVYVSRMFPEVCPETLEQCVVSLQDSSEESMTWNRRTRRSCAKAQGLMIHAFCGPSKKVFEAVARKWDVAHLAVDGNCGDPSKQDLLICQERAQRNVDDVLILRFLVLIVLAAEVNKSCGVPAPAVLVENPCSEVEVGAPDVLGNEHTQVSLWNTPEWQVVAQSAGLSLAGFFQSPMGHCKRRPTGLGTNVELDPMLVECGVRAEVLDYVPIRDFGVKTELWTEWAPGLAQALSSMLHRRFAEMRREVSFGGEIRKVDPGFLHHLQQNHMPYRNDCATCLKGSARRKQHRRVLTPQSWCLSIDTAGPFVRGRDEHTPKARYLIVGVLSVPVLAVDGKDVDEPCDADPGPEVPSGGVLEDAEWLADKVGDAEEPLPECTAKDAAEVRSAWNEWDRLVKSSREDWIEEAQAECLPKVEIVDFVYVEAIERKTHGEMLTAVGRMHARAKAEGFDVRRLHSDRGREYNNKSLRDWCARHSIHKTFAVAEEHQGNGRAEGAIMRVKNKTRVILEESGPDKSEWPLAAKLAAHELKNEARRRLKIQVSTSCSGDKQELET